MVSDESVERDTVITFAEYAAAGVREYWLIDPDAQTARFFRLADNGQYEPIPVEGGAFRSGVIYGFWLRVEWLWQSPPDVWAALRALGLVG